MLSYKASFVNKLGKGTVLDYGSGVGVFAAFLKDRGYDLTTVEPSKSARKACDYKGLVCYSSLDEIPESMSFSTITLWHVLEHLPDLDGILNQLQSRLTPEGSLIIAVPNLNSHDAEYYNSNWAALDVPRHLWHFSSPGLIKLVEQHNLVFESQHPLWFDALYISYMSEVQKKTSFTFIRGICVGLWSNLKAYTSGQYSSKIYVFKKST
jgi:predicted SAM-dependent methyltransferase